MFAGRRLANITTTDIRAFVALRLAAGAANGEINRELSALKRMYTLAVQAGKLHAKPYIPMLQEDNVRRGSSSASNSAQSAATCRRRCASS